MCGLRRQLRRVTFQAQGNNVIGLSISRPGPVSTISKENKRVAEDVHNNTFLKQESFSSASGEYDIRVMTNSDDHPRLAWDVRPDLAH
jgi:hypothetical protein